MMYIMKKASKSTTDGFGSRIYKSSAENPAELYKRCKAAKLRNCSERGKAHLATRNSRDTKPDSRTVKGEAEYGAIT